MSCASPISTFSLTLCRGALLTIKLNFLFNSQFSSCEAVSASDYVEFSNSMTEDSRFGRYCGQMKEFHVESDRNFFKVTFRSNDRLDGTGFKAIFQFLEVTDEYHATVQDTASSTGEFTITSFIINSLSCLS